ncbi:hypothetical protein FMEAI12_940001 [Parafrankia sp. Ea1.12]|nr:hypothetical protein FMEAI12_940001 [Parafrankia sp. Ea1.12]
MGLAAKKTMGNKYHLLKHFWSTSIF